MTIKKNMFSMALPTLGTKKKIENKEIELFMSKDSEEVYELTLDSGLSTHSTTLPSLFLIFSIILWPPNHNFF